MRFWWIDKPRLAGSNNPTDADLRKLREEGFAILVSLLDESEQRPNYGPEYARELGYQRHRLPIADFHAPSIEQFEKFLELAKSAREDAKLLVHCQGGSGRTGTMGAGYWISQGLSKSEAVDRVRHARPQAVETEEQHESLERLEDLFR